MENIKLTQTLISQDGTQKFLFQLTDGSLIESVLMTQDFGQSLCVTTQVGCNMGCKFCASGLLKKERNLAAEEILLQVAKASEVSGMSITHVVLMGTGEPFDNFDEVIHFCDIISSEKLLRGIPFCSSLQPIAPRHITVSTCGLAPKIYDFIKTRNRYNLAISLHAPNDMLRNELMPINKKYPLKDLMEAVFTYCAETKRRVTFEYILLDGVNDSDQCALELASLLKGVDAYVNLIPFNAVSEFSFQGASKEKALHFYDILMQNKIRTTLRKERGLDISAACGQLRAEALKL